MHFFSVISPAAVSSSPALPKGLSSMSSLASMDSSGAEPLAGLCSSAHTVVGKSKPFRCQLSSYAAAEYCFFGSGEKRKIPETLTLEDAKRIRVMGDIPMELVNEVMMTITDPAAMLGPEVIHEGAGWLYVVQ